MYRSPTHVLKSHAWETGRSLSVGCNNEAVNGAPNLAARPRFDPADGAVDVTGLTKTFGALKAVDDLTFTVTPGRVTGSWDPTGRARRPPCACCWVWRHPMPAPVTIGGIPYGQRPARHAT